MEAFERRDPNAPVSLVRPQLPGTGDEELDGDERDLTPKGRLSYERSFATSMCTLTVTAFLPCLKLCGRIVLTGGPLASCGFHSTNYSIGA